MRKILILTLASLSIGAAAEIPAEVAEGLRSPVIKDRMIAFQSFKQILAGEASLTTEEKRTAIELLSREDQVIAEAARQGMGTSYKYGEGYTEYAGSVAMLV